MLVFCITGALLLGISVYLFIPVHAKGKEVQLIVEPGTSVRLLARLLEEKKVISHQRVFLIWLRINGLDKSVQSGKYTFYQYEGIISAARDLKSVQAIELSVTIPEGLTIEQTAVKMTEVLGLDTATFFSLCRDRNFIENLGLPVETLEGYLFPDSYRFHPNVRPDEVIIRMVESFKKEYASILQTTQSARFTQAQIVTLASIVEKEATLPAERSHIAGVFLNRLRMDIPLGADPTIRYVLKKFSGQLRVSELQNTSPYNTRIHAGLPPGPICSPGKGSIEAVINPLKTKDLYFVAKWDGTGAHDFSQTNAEHERKKSTIRIQNQLRISKKEMKEKTQR